MISVDKILQLIWYELPGAKVTFLNNDIKMDIRIDYKGIKHTHSVQVFVPNNLKYDVEINMFNSVEFAIQQIKRKIIMEEALK